MPINLPLFDGHCHVDLFFKYGLHQDEFNKQLSHGRNIIFIDNRHHHTHAHIPTFVISHRLK